MPPSSSLTAFQTIAQHVDRGSKRDEILENARNERFGICKALMNKYSASSDQTKKSLVNAVDEKGWTLLHFAAKADDCGMISWLMKGGGGGGGGGVKTRGGKSEFYKIMATTGLRKQTALHTAAFYGHLKACRAIVGGCQSPEQQTQLLNAVDKQWWTALHVAVEKKNHAVISWFLSSRPNGGRTLGFDSLLAKTKDAKRTALHVAVDANDLDACKLLLDGCKDEDEKYNLLHSLDRYGWTPLHTASYNKFSPIAEWLLGESAHCHYYGKAGSGLQMCTPLVLMRTFCGKRTALHIAVDVGSLEMCKTIINGCKGPEEKRMLFATVNREGRTVLAVASSRFHNDIINELMTHPEITYIYNSKDNMGLTALHRAVVGCPFTEKSSPDRQSLTRALLAVNNSEFAIDPNAGKGTWSREGKN